MASAKLAAKQSTREVCRESEQVQGNAKRYGRCVRQGERLRATCKNRDDSNIRPRRSIKSDELSLFTRDWPSIWSKVEYNKFIEWIAANPKSEDVIKGSGGVRKVRWASGGHGKRGGAKIIVYSADADYLYLMIIYTKNQQVDISSKELNTIKEMIE